MIAQASVRLRAYYETAERIAMTLRGYAARASFTFPSGRCYSYLLFCFISYYLSKIYKPSDQRSLRRHIMATNNHVNTEIPLIVQADIAHPKMPATHCILC